MGVPKIPGSTPFRFQEPSIPPANKVIEPKPLAASELIKDPLQNPPDLEPFTASRGVSNPEQAERIVTASSQVFSTSNQETLSERIDDPRLKDLVQHRIVLENKIRLFSPKSEGPSSSSSATQTPISQNSLIDHILSIPPEVLSPSLQKLVSDYRPIKEKVAPIEKQIKMTLREFLSTAVETPKNAKDIANARTLADRIQSYEQHIEHQFNSERQFFERDLGDIQSRIQSWTPENIPPMRISEGRTQKFLLDHLIYPAASLFSLKADHFSDRNAAAERLSRGNLISNFNQDPLNTSLGGLKITFAKDFHTEETDGFARRVKFYTEDQIQLDGCMIFSDPTNNDLQTKKMMVIAYGNAQPWELSYHHAKLMARKYNVNVMVYNPRGVILSKGEMVSTDDAIKDCKAAIQYAQRHACPENPERLCVFGQSIGGGVTARALQELKNEHQIGEHGVGLYINNHSFRSLKHVSKGIAKDLPGTGFLTSLSKRLLRKAKHDVLNAKKAIAQTKLANRVIVVTSRDDSIISGSAQLKNGLQSVQNVVNEVLYIDSGFGHNDIERYLLGHSEDLPISDPRQALYQSIVAWTNE